MADDSPKKNDIDFDELDKAVNSLMGTVGSETLEDSEKTKTLDVNSTLKDGEKPLYGALEKVAESIGNETLATDGEVELHEDLTELPDVMPPDLSQVTEAPAKPEEPEPETEPEEVEKPAEAATEEHSEPEEPTDEAKPEEKTEDEPAEEPKPAPAVKRPNSGRFMDMVHPKADMRSASGTPPMPELIVPERKGMIGGAAEPLKPVAAIVAAAPAPTPKVIISPIEFVAPAETPQTPFLPDAKVEKRPLGGSIAVSFGDDKKSEDSDTESEKEEKPVQTGPINSENIKDDDGSGDEQRALNASDFTAETESEQALTKIEASEVAGENTALTIEKVESGDTESLKAPKKPTYEEVVEPDKPAANATGAIYDTKEYHQPIAHPPKQKSGWSTVLVIIIIIVLAVAIAGGAYLYFGMPK